MSLKRVKDEHDWWPRGWGLGLTRLYYAEHFGFDLSPLLRSLTRDLLVLLILYQNEILTKNG